MTKKEAERLYDEGLFQKGSIAPKVRAAIHFLKHHGNKVIITSILTLKMHWMEVREQK